LPVTPLYRLLHQWLPVHTPLYNLVVSLESRVGRSHIKTRYAADMQREYESIRQALPGTCSAVLDIGCGVAGIDVLLQRHYANQPIHFYLLDRSRVEKRVFYMFQPQAAFYNSLDVSRAMLTGNGIAPAYVHLIEANDQASIDIETQVDVVLSLLSWGFHYPVAMYVDRVHALLRAPGVVILDVRKGTDGMDVLRRTFRHVEVVLNTPKYDRVVCGK
jgi:SAM-dependent methyltransferase